MSTRNELRALNLSDPLSSLELLEAGLYLIDELLLSFWSYEMTQTYTTFLPVWLQPFQTIK